MKKIKYKNKNQIIHLILKRNKSKYKKEIKIKKIKRQKKLKTKKWSIKSKNKKWINIKNKVAEKKEIKKYNQQRGCTKTKKCGI